MKHLPYIVIAFVAVGLLTYGILSHHATAPTPNDMASSTATTSPTPASLTTDQLDTFATCIDHSSTTFYGAFWCPHCQAQKKLFGSAVDKLPYVECSNPDQSQNQTCDDANITGYPTWQFPDGSRLSGEQSLATLSQKTGCPLP